MSFILEKTNLTLTSLRRQHAAWSKMIEQALRPRSPRFICAILLLLTVKRKQQCRRRWRKRVAGLTWEDDTSVPAGRQTKADGSCMPRNGSFSNSIYFFRMLCTQKVAPHLKCYCGNTIDFFPPKVLVIKKDFELCSFLCGQYFLGTFYHNYVHFEQLTAQRVYF